ncbi:alpha/beta fold hydrolase [Microbacterium sp. RD1]|uniref:alpha/beta fold hydrolase n=1 Tax=Microbacterium sp. RD1 TaxID=3457313 RepID=UPI003FA547A6
MKLWTTTVGDGPKRAALVHGITGDGGTWFELAPWIAEQGYTVTLVDQRGHGKSGRAESYTPEELADDLVETLGEGFDVIAGHSLGGRTLTMAVDRLHPQRAIYLDPGWVIPENLVITPPVHADGSWFRLEELAEILPGYSQAHLEQGLRSVQAFDLTFLDAPTFPLAAVLPPDEPVVPSLIIAPDTSPLVPESLRERLTAGGYEIRLIPGAHHDLHIVNLEETKAALHGWI